MTQTKPPEQGGYIRALYSLFSYGGVHPRTVQSTVQDLFCGPKGGVLWRFKAEHQDAAIDRSRSVAARDFLKTDCDVHFCLDHDVEYDEGGAVALVKKAQETRGLVAAMVSKKGFARGYGTRLPSGSAVKLGEDCLVEMGPDTYVGGAMMAIHRDAYEAVMSNHPVLRTGIQNVFQPIEKFNEGIGRWEYLSEDWAFTHRCREAGVPVYTYGKPKTVHWGELGFTPITADPHQTAKEDGILRP